jgi:hypothetical protein
MTDFIAQLPILWWLFLAFYAIVVAVFMVLTKARR